MKQPISSLIGKSLALTGLTASVMFSVKPAEAAILNVGGTNYNVISVYGSYNDLSTILQANSPWWGNSNQALSFAKALGSSLPQERSSSTYEGLNDRSLFAWQTSLLDPTVVQAAVWSSESGRAGFTGTKSDRSTYYSVVTASSTPSEAVPEPLTILGTVTGIGFGAAFKRKKKKC